MARRVLPTVQLPGERVKCRFCGRVVIRNDADRMLHHEAPSCPEYDRVVKETGGQRFQIVVSPPSEKS